MTSCNLCHIVSRGLPRGRVYEDDLLVVLMDTSDGPAQMLVVPKLHEGSLEALGAAAQHHLYKISRRAGRSLHVAAGIAPDVRLQVLPADEGHAHLKVLAAAS